MPSPTPVATLADWIARDATACALDDPASVDAAVDRVVEALGSEIDLLGLGEALHGGEAILALRNRVFQRLVVAHGYRAIAIESSLPRARLVNDYIAGHGPATYAAIEDAGFGHGFGRLDANRELVAWMRDYNADPAHPVKLRFHGFDIPGLAGGIASPRQVLMLVLDYLAIDPAIAAPHRERIEALLGTDAAWENPQAMVDATQAIGLSPDAVALRIAVEDLITALTTQRPALVAATDRARHAEAMHLAIAARQLLTFHAGLARNAGPAALLGIRDASMADNLAYLVGVEHERGGVLAFAHNTHLQRGEARLQLGPTACAWWPAGAHLAQRLDGRYAAIGTAIGVSEPNGIGAPEAGTLEARLAAASALFIPTHRGAGLPAAELAALAARSGSAKNPSYVPLTAHSVSDFDWLVMIQTTSYSRGAAPLRG